MEGEMAKMGGKSHGKDFLSSFKGGKIEMELAFRCLNRAQKERMSMSVFKPTPAYLVWGR